MTKHLQEEDNMVHWELYKAFKFDLTKKWYMHNLESVLKN